MDQNPTPKPASAEGVPDLPVAPDEADEVTGGKAKPKLADYASKGKHLPDVQR
jgi:hypothetical protein